MKNENGINVLSLFDGISAGQVALERAGIKVNKYYASEIDKFAIAVTQYRYPDTIQLGSITEWETWDLQKIDLVIGGSPCQGFSFAGKQLNFDDPRSKLFFDFVNVVNEFNPKYFMLENVRMKKEYQDVITEFMGVEAILINSSLVSAQNRNRLYWTNIPNIEQPEDNGIYLKDIIETGDVDRLKSYCIDANYFKGGSLKNYLEKKRRQLDKLPSEPHTQSENRLMVEENTIPFARRGHGYLPETIYDAEKSPAIFCGSSDYYVHSNQKCIQTGEADIKGHDIIRRTYDVNGKSPTLTTMGGGHREPKITTSETTWRKLTPLECERLQTFEDGYSLVPWKKRMMSNTQRYKQLGNSWTVDVIVHIFKNMEF